MIIHVAVGVIVNSENNVLVAERHSHTDHGGLWEFPGGKIEAQETAYVALCRELKEELDLEVISASPLMQVSHDYSRYSVFLNTWLVKEFRGEPYGAEGQKVKWVSVEELKNLEMPEASHSIIALLNAS